MYIRIKNWGEIPNVDVKVDCEEIGLIPTPEDVVLNLGEALVDKEKFFLAVIKYGIEYEDISKEVLDRKPYNMYLQKMVYSNIMEMANSKLITISLR